MRKDNLDVYQQITDSIIRELEAGHAPWLKPWCDTKANRAKGAGGWQSRNAISGRPYQGFNILATWMHMARLGLDSGNPIFLTYNQAKAFGGWVRKGEKGCLVVAYRDGTKRVPDASAEGGERLERRFYAVAHYVFHIGQTEGVTLPEVPPAKRAVGLETDEAWQAFLANTKADIRHGGDRAYYSPSHDYVQMPTASAFHAEAGYKATLLHELTHWTGHKSRLDRKLNSGRFGNEAYAFEELVAEMGSCFACAELGIELDPEAAARRAAGYIASWLKVLKNDRKAIVTAASQAGKACQWLATLSRGEVPVPSAQSADGNGDPSQGADLAA